MRCVGEAVVRALVSHQSGLGWNLKADAIYGLSLLSVLVLARRGFSPDTPVFLSPQNQHFQITIQSGMPGLTSSWALSIPQKLRFEISEISRAQWSGTSRLHRPDPSHRAFGYCSCKQDTKWRYWEQQFDQMETHISIRPTEMTRPVKVDHLESWSRIFRSEQTEMVRSIWVNKLQFTSFTHSLTVHNSPWSVCSCLRCSSSSSSPTTSSPAPTPTTPFSGTAWGCVANITTTLFSCWHRGECLH